MTSVTFDISFDLGLRIFIGEWAIGNQYYNIKIKQPSPINYFYVVYMNLYGVFIN
jgi:hypothetical protein